MMKKTLFTLSILFFFIIASTAYAQGFVPLAEIPGLTDARTATNIISERNFGSFFNNLYKFCVGLSAALAVIMIVWGGLEISTQDSISKQSAGRERITQAILGLILVLSPVLVFSIINPRILNLSLSFPAVNLDFTPYTPVTRTPDSTNLNESPQSGKWCYKNSMLKYTCSDTYPSCTSKIATEKFGVTVPNDARCTQYP